MERMSERTYTNQNLAGILSEALGLEGGGGRSSFSSSHREALREALEHESAPATFAELLQTLRAQEAGEGTISAVQKLAANEPGRSLQEFAVNYTPGS